VIFALRVPFCLLFALAANSAALGASAGNDYTQEQNWLCRPGRSDACSTPTTSTVIAAGGGAPRVVSHDVAAAPPIDCFYVYPTVSREPTANSDMASTGVEEATARAQFAPFVGQCRPFAPRYRQVTVAGLRSALRGGERPDTALAYDDVLAAWHNYLVRDNQGRGFVLIGHSQGSKILAQLIAAEIDGKPLAARFVSAIIPGTLIEVPARADAGGTYSHIALCQKASDTACVIAYSSYLATDAPVQDARYGVTATPGRAAACVDPARLSAQAFLDAEFPAKLLSRWAIDTTFIDLPGVIKGECVTRGGQTFLAIAVPDRDHSPVLAEGLAALQARRPDWGLHVIDMNLALGNLVAIVAAQAQAWKDGAAASTGHPH
jgi:hypothetical protein